MRCQIKSLPMIVGLLVLPWLHPGGALAEPKSLILRGDVLTAVAVSEGDGHSRLAVVVADDTRPHPQRSLVWLRKEHGDLVVASQQPLQPEDHAFDVCSLHGEHAPAEVLTLRPDGIYRLGSKTPLAATTTLMAQPSDDAVPRVHVCLPLFAGKPPALVVPTLAGVALFSSAEGDSYHALLSLPTTANATYNFSTAPPRSDGLEATQAIALRLEYPTVSVQDFNGDGLNDLCLSRGESLQCYLQGPDGFSVEHAVSFNFPVRSEAERQQQSVRVLGQLLALGRGEKPSYLVSKTEWNVSDMRTSLYIFRQQKSGGFAGKPAQTISRKGYFAFQEFIDLEGRGRLDLVAPTTAMGWTDLMKIYLEKTASLDFLRYKNNGDNFAEPEVLHSLSFPVDFKRLTSLTAALPLWTLKGPEAPGARGRTAAFFPGKDAIDLVRFQTDSDAALQEHLLAHIPVTIGDEALATDLDGDGVSEVVFYFPRLPGSERKIVMVDLAAAKI